MSIKRTASYIIFLIVIIFIIISVYNFSLKNNENKISNNPIELKNNLKNENTISEKPVEVKTNPMISKIFDTEQKVKKATEFSKQLKRRPSANSAIIPQHLIENTLLKTTTWKIWPHTHVIHYDTISASDQILAQISNLVIISSQYEESDLTEFNVESPVPVFDIRLKKAGIITGIIKIKTKEKAKLEHDLIINRARISDSFDHLNTYFVTSTDRVFNLELLYENLKSNPYIEMIEIDIMSKNYEKL